jgi:phage-related protein
MKPDDKVGSAIKCIQTVIDNLTQKINKYLRAITSYIDAVSSGISSLQNLIANAACEIAKYMKIIFDKIMEYVLKLLNKTLTKVVSALPSSLRSQFGDIKEIITELILQLYNKITAGLCALIQDLLNKALKPDDAEKQARASQVPDGCNKTPKVPICYAEEIVGQAIAFNKQQIDETNNTILDNINVFLDDVQNQLAGVSGALSDITSLAGTISGSMSSALSFSNLILNLFAGELPPNVAVSDFYTFGGGGAGQPDSSTPSVKSVEEAANKPSTGSPTQEVPYLEPSKATPTITSR